MATVFKLLAWLLRVAVFVLLFGLALKNGGSVELRFFFDRTWQAPVSVVVLTVFAAGLAVGLSVALTMVFRRKGT